MSSWIRLQARGTESSAEPMYRILSRSQCNCSNASKRWLVSNQRIPAVQTERGTFFSNPAQLFQCMECPEPSVIMSLQGCISEYYVTRNPSREWLCKSTTTSCNVQNAQQNSDFELWTGQNSLWTFFKTCQFYNHPILKLNQVYSLKSTGDFSREALFSEYLSETLKETYLWL